MRSLHVYLFSQGPPRIQCVLLVKLARARSRSVIGREFFFDLRGAANRCWTIVVARSWCGNAKMCAIYIYCASKIYYICGDELVYKSKVHRSWEAAPECWFCSYIYKIKQGEATHQKNGSKDRKQFLYTISIQRFCALFCARATDLLRGRTIVARSHRIQCAQSNLVPIYIMSIDQRKHETREQQLPSYIYIYQISTWLIIYVYVLIWSPREAFFFW